MGLSSMGIVSLVLGLGCTSYPFEAVKVEKLNMLNLSFTFRYDLLGVLSVIAEIVDA